MNRHFGSSVRLLKIVPHGGDALDEQLAAATSTGFDVTLLDFSKERDSHEVGPVLHLLAKPHTLIVELGAAQDLTAVCIILLDVG